MLHVRNPHYAPGNARNLFKLKKKRKSNFNKRGFLSMRKKIIAKPVRVGSFWSNNYIEYENNRP